MKFSLFQCKYTILGACPGGTATIKIVWILKKSEFDLMGGGQHLSEMS